MQRGEEQYRGQRLIPYYTHARAHTHTTTDDDENVIESAHVKEQGTDSSEGGGGGRALPQLQGHRVSN